MFIMGRRYRTMKEVSLYHARDVVGAREDILNHIPKNLTTHNSTIFYFDGWSGLGTTAVLRSIAQVLPSMKDPPPELCFSRTIYIDCSTWESQRMMQRKISDELKLDQKAMDMFQEQDEEDDFNGVDHASRDVIPSVAAVIDKTLRESRFMMILINGSDDELDLRRFGIPEYHDCVILWSFGRRFTTMSDPDKISRKLRYTNVFIYCPTDAKYLSTSLFVALFREETAAGYPSMREMDLTTVVDCWLFGLLLYQSFCSTTGFAWPAHAANYWICDGIIQGDRAHQITNALNPQKNFEGDAYVLNGVFKNFKEDPNTPFLVVTDGDDDVYKKRPCFRWISVTLKNKKVHEGMQSLFARASSIFLAFENEKHNPLTLPKSLFKQCRNLGVLVLSCCAFNFLSPPFLHCHTLRFLGLDHCMDEKNAVAEGGDCTAIRWAFLKSMWVIDLYYTDWVEILSEDKIYLMDNLMELNIKGVRCSQFISQLQKGLPYIRRLGIIKPMYEEGRSSIDITDSLTNKRNLEILDLSGNTYMKSLPASISMAIHLEVLILDGCEELENVVVPNGLPSSLRSFSFDCYGPAFRRPSTIVLPPESRRPEHPPDSDKKDVKTSMISLEGCRQLDSLFLRGLPNLVELDLSGCAIKVLDFETMVVDVPMLKRLFLLGCERLRAINWGSDKRRQGKLMNLLELVCIDTRSRRALGCDLQSLDTLPRSFKRQMHVITADARLVRSLFDLIHFAMGDVCFSINITSSTPCSGAVVQPEEKARKMMETTDDQEHHVVAGLYGDIFTEVGNGTNQMQAFPQPPIRQLDHHIEIGYGSRAVQSEMGVDYYEYGMNTIARLMTEYTQSLHVHDVRNCSNTMPTKPNTWYYLRWCRVERCPDLHAVFPTDTEELFGELEIIWASDLLMARCIWSKGRLEGYYCDRRFKGLQHLHLRCCPSLRFGVAMDCRPSFPSLETLHIIHCGDLRRIFVPGDEANRHTSVQFPKLTTIHLHDLPSLQQICEAVEMVTPALETIRIRGCPNLRRLPAIKGREAGMRMPAVEVEKDVWDALEWDGADAGHHPSLYEKPLHSRYYKQSRLLRGTVLR